MEAAYFQAAIPEPVRIFGLRLLPLSLGRYRLLCRFGCAFVADGEALATAGDLLLGILICSMRCAEWLEFVESPESGDELAKLGQRIELEVAADPYFNLLEKFGLFKNYIEGACLQPKYWEEKEDEGPSGAHWSQSLEVTLRSELGYSTEDIEEGPLSKALADFYKHAENHGLIRLMTDEEIRQVEEIEAQKEVKCPA
ncbi:MAG TPA: hypothetical protein VG167_18950 [Verrucomicrobiae bacterium]|nr:hypothetical protein [Verrucomicrobiae bacterium]